MKICKFFLQQECIEFELGILIEEDIIKFVKHSDWTIPIFSVIKQIGKLCICAN